MATNLQNLPQIPAGTTITISSDADFTDEFFIGVPNFNSTPILINGSIVTGAFQITNIPSTSGFVPGMAVTGFGIPPGTIIAPGGVSTNTLTLNNALTQTVTGLNITILPPPLDLTGISFTSAFRQSVSSATVLIQMSTPPVQGAVPGTTYFMVNNNQAGTFGWNIPAAKLPGFFGSTTGNGQIQLVLGIHATDTTGAIIDMCSLNGPIPVTVNVSAV